MRNCVNIFLDSQSITTLVQMEYSAFEEANGSDLFVGLGSMEKKKVMGFYFRLSDFFRGRWKFRNKKC